jgi:hypothetical protein
VHKQYTVVLLLTRYVCHLVPLLLQVVVVANPACTNCLMAMRYAPSLNPKNFSALTRLDHDRLKVTYHVPALRHRLHRMQYVRVQHVLLVVLAGAFMQHMQH